MSEMSEMIERVARAICVANGEDDDDTYATSATGSPIWRYYESHAIAAITAMREPTGEMIDGGAESLWTLRGPDLNGQPSKCWRAMINAALRDDASASSEPSAP